MERFSRFPAPPPEAEEARGLPLFTFMQVSDAHVGNDANRPVHERLEAAIRLANTMRPAFVIDSGDMTTHPAYEASPAFLAELDEYRTYAAKLQVPLYALPGNHDIGYFAPRGPRASGTPWGNHTDLVAAYRMRVGPLDQSFTHAGFRFVLVNNNPAYSKGPGHLSAEQLRWIEEELGRGQRAFVFCHIEVLEEGTGAPWGRPAQLLANLCRRHGVPAVAYGHKHKLLVTDWDDTAYIMCPDLKVPGHRSILQYRVHPDRFELWLYDVVSGVGERVAERRYPALPAKPGL